MYSKALWSARRFAAALAVLPQWVPHTPFLRVEFCGHFWEGIRFPGPCRNVSGAHGFGRAVSGRETNVALATEGFFSSSPKL
jgi:hypothetical protein